MPSPPVLPVSQAAQISPAASFSQAPAVSPMPDWQKAAGGHLEFDVAAIHLAQPDTFKPPLFPLSPDDSYVQTGGHFFAQFPLSVYIEFAYKLWLTDEQRSALVAHLPKWVSSDSFVIEARAPGNPTKDQMRLMVQSLLVERFKLALHFETRNAAVYALVLEKPGVLGPKLRPHAQGPPCDPNANLRDPAWVEAQRNVFPAMCDMFALRVAKDNTYTLGSRDATIPGIGYALPSLGHLGRPVIDQTGLSGRYDFVLEWNKEPDAGAAPPSAADIPQTSFLEALHDQLGLKLKSTRADISVPVIDHLEQPSEN